MVNITRDIQWRKEQRLDYDVELIGTFKVSSMSVIKSHVAGDKDIEELAKAQAIRTVHGILYGEVQDKLLELERMILLSRPDDYLAGDGPLEKVREIQALISEYR